MSDETSRALPPVPLEPLAEDDPSQLGDYRLLGRLGSGGMGVAYLASDSTRNWIVVKTIWPHLAADRAFRARLVRELQVMRTVSGTTTAALLNADTETKTPWFAMEFIPGMTLARTVEDSGPLPSGEIGTFARDLLNVLQSVHTAGVTHRDLKPANIMLSPNGPRLIDFGIADLEGGTQLTGAGAVLGSTGWLAPEQVRGDDATTATDVHAWALCVMYAATGVPPFGADTSAAAIYRVLETTPDVPASIREPLHGVLVQALAKDPAQRPTLQRITAALAEPTPTPQLQQTPQLAPQPKPTPAVSTGPVVPVTDSRNAAIRPAQPRRSKRAGVGWWIMGTTAVAFIAVVAFLSSNPNDDNGFARDTDTIPVGSRPWGVAIAPDGSRVYVVNANDGSVSVIDAESNTVTRSIRVGSEPLGVAVTPDGSRVYVTNRGSNSVSVIDAVSNTVTGTIPVSSRPRGVAVTPDGSRVYVTNRGSNSVSVIDAVSNTVTDTIPVGSEPFGIAVAPDSSRIYVANEGSGSVSVIDAVSNTVSNTIPDAGEVPWLVALAPDGNTIYVTGMLGRSVLVIDAVSNTVIDTIPVGGSSLGVAVSPDGSQVYVSKPFSDSVSVIDAISNTVTVTTPVGSEPRGVVVAPDGNRIYVPNQGSDSVSVIDVS